jgi:alcohol dehydrogenase
MKAIVFNNAPCFDPKHPNPPISDGDSLVRVRQAGICSTDIEITRGYMQFTGIIGHEFVGVVEASANEKWIGKRVVGEINCPCGTCDLCVAGLANHCRRRTVVGIAGRDGAFAEFIRLPADNLHIVPDNVDDDHAVFTEPLAAALQILKQVRIDARTWVTVLGDGRLGLLVAQVLRNAGCPVRVVGKHTDKLALCEKWQIRSRLLADVALRHDQDVVVDCTSSASGFETAMAMVRPRGTIVLKSTVAAAKPLNLAPLVIDEITVVGSRCGPFREALRVLSEQSVDVVSLIHRRMKIESGIEALETAGRPGVLKVILLVNPA